MKMINLKLAIFDMDGLIFDSEKIYIDEFPKIFKEEGFELKTEDILQTIGKNEKSCEEFYLSLFPKLDFKKVCLKLENKLKEISSKGKLPLKEGVINLLEYLKHNNVILALASSSNKDKIIKFLKDAKIYNYFDYIISGEDVKFGKPNPEIFLKVIQKFNIKENEAIVFEDSVNGVLASVAAKIPVIMIPDLIYPDEEIKNKTMLVLNNLSEVLDYLRNRGDK